MHTVVNADGAAESGSLIGEIVREGAQRMLAAALEAEVNAYVAELAGQRDERGRRLVVHNGDRAERAVATAARLVQVKAPRVNDQRVDEATGERKRFSSWPRTTERSRPGTFPGGLRLCLGRLGASEGATG